MDEWIWINGQVMRLADATIGVEERGFQFADGVYEVIRLYAGRPFRLGDHLERLTTSATGILLDLPMSQEKIAEEIHRLLPRSGVSDGMVYLQLTRGQSPRNHLFPSPEEAKPTLLFYVRSLPPAPAPGQGAGVKLVSMEDFRWKRCWIKSIALLPNVLAKNAAVAAGGDEAVFIDEGIVTECAVSNFYAVFGEQIVTHPVGPRVLGGITRQVLRQAAQELDISWSERPLRQAEAVAADEAFITSTTREISWVSHWTGQPLGGARCGSVTRRLHEALVRIVRSETAVPAVVAAVAAAR